MQPLLWVSEKSRSLSGHPELQVPGDNRPIEDSITDEGSRYWESYQGLMLYVLICIMICVGVITTWLQKRKMWAWPDERESHPKKWSHTQWDWQWHCSLWIWRNKLKEDADRRMLWTGFKKARKLGLVAEFSGYEALRGQVRGTRLEE